MESIFTSKLKHLSWSPRNLFPYPTSTCSLCAKMCIKQLIRRINKKSTSRTKILFLKRVTQESPQETKLNTHSKLPYSHLNYANTLQWLVSGISNYLNCSTVCASMCTCVICVCVLRLILSIESWLAWSLAYRPGCLELRNAPACLLGAESKGVLVSTLF